MVVFLIVFTGIIFFAPEMGGYFLEYNNFVPANTLQTPDHIAPVWYFTPYYAILRAVPDQRIRTSACSPMCLGGSPVTTALEPKPMRVKNIFICGIVVF